MLHEIRPSFYTIYRANVASVLTNFEDSVILTRADSLVINSKGTTDFKNNYPVVIC